MSQECQQSAQTMALNNPKSWAAIISGFVSAAIGGALLYFEIPLDGAPVWTWKAVAVVCFVIGVLGLFGRTGSVIQKESGTVTKWWGLLFPMFKSSRRVSPEAIRLSHHEFHSRGQVAHWYPITLECTGDRIELDRHQEVMPAWAVAQNVATFLGVELVDDSQMAEVW